MECHLLAHPFYFFFGGGGICSSTTGCAKAAEMH